MFVFFQGGGSERMVSGSDDFTLFLWNPSEEKKALARMTGHQVCVVFVCLLVHSVFSILFYRPW